MKKIRVTYLSAARDVADQVAAASIREVRRGYSALTTESLRSIEAQLRAAADDITYAIETNTTAGIRLAVEKVGTINDTFLSEAFNRAGAAKIKRGTIAQIVSGLNTQVVTSAINRVWQDGYTFSQRVWRVGQRFQDDIKNVLASGLSQGRDALRIAQDIQVYTRDGKVALMQRYGELVRGTREFSRRIPKVVDYRAIRLVRSELYESLYDANLEFGKMNPAGEDLWDWIRGGSVDWGCDCPDYLAHSPYTLDALPSRPHPNCLCTVQRRVQKIDDFESRITAWADGGRDAQLDEWYRTYYLPTESA